MSHTLPDLELSISRQPHQMEVRLNPEEAFDLYVYEGSELEKQSNSENEGTEHVT